MLITFIVQECRIKFFIPLEGSYTITYKYFCCCILGLGFNVNIPFSDDKMGDAEYKKAFDTIVFPITSQFEPELVIISAGYDAREGDPLGQYHVSDNMFGYMTSQLRTLASGKTVMLMEGGYNPANLAKSVCICVRVLQGETIDEVEDSKELLRSAETTIQQVIQVQKRFWKL